MRNQGDGGRPFSFAGEARLALLARFSGFAVSRLAATGHFVLLFFRTFFAGSKKALGERKSLLGQRSVCGARQNSRGTNSCRTRTVWRVGCLPADGSRIPWPSRHAQNSRSTLLNAQTGCAWFGSLGMVMPKQSPRSPLEKGMTHDAACFARAACALHHAPCNLGHSFSELLSVLPETRAGRRRGGTLFAFAAPSFPPRYSLGLRPRLPALSRGSRADDLGSFSF